MTWRLVMIVKGTDWKCTQSDLSLTSLLYDLFHDCHFISTNVDLLAGKPLELTFITGECENNWKMQWREMIYEMMIIMQWWFHKFNRKWWFNKVKTTYLTHYSKDLMELFCARQRRKFSRGIKRAWHGWVCLGGRGKTMQNPWNLCWFWKSLEVFCGLFAANTCYIQVE